MINFDEMTAENQLRDLVRPRADWFDLGAIETGLAKILPEFTNLGVYLPHMDFLLEACRQRAVSDVVDIDKQEERGIKGLKGSFPQHAAVVELGRRETVAPALLRLSALIIACVSDWERKLTTAGRPEQDVIVFTRRVKIVWRQVRRISDAGVKMLPPITRDVEEFHNLLDDALEDIDPRDAEALGHDHGYLEELARFFNFYLGGGRKYNRARKKGEPQLEIHSKSSPKATIPDDPDSDMEANSALDSQLVSCRNTKQLRATEHYLSGNSPDEVEDEPRLLQSKRPIVFNYGGNPVQAAIRLANRKVHQRRVAQILPGRWSTLTDAELRSVLLAIQERTADSNHSAKLILLLSLLTGRELDAVLATSIVRNTQQLPKSTSKQDTSDIYLIAETREWAVRVLGPESRRRIHDEWNAVLQTHESIIRLPIPPGFWETLEPLISSRSRKAKKKSVKAFIGIDEEEVRKQARAFLSAVNRGNKGRLTLNRIAYQLTEELHVECGDLIEAILVTGRQPPYGASAALYYHHCDRQRLVDSYLNVTRHWQELVSPDSPTIPERQRELIDGSVGSDLVIDTPIVAALFGALREQIGHDRSLLGTLEGLRVFHNSLTNYALLMTFWLTGYRAVQDPVSKPSDLNVRRRLLVIADKTGDGFGHSRMVPVCQVLAEQLEAYQSHTAWLRNRLSFFEHRSQETVFFYLDGDFNEKQVRPSSMQDLLEWAYVLPLNLSRHWLRGELCRQGVPGPYVDRFMGHWSMGQEPWGRYSTVDPIDFHNALNSALGRLADELNLQVVRGIA